MKLPDLMHATQVPRPVHTKGWVYEEKYDGWRMLALNEAGRVPLVSRNGRDHTKRFREIADALARHSSPPPYPYFDSDYRVEDLGWDRNRS